MLMALRPLPFATPPSAIFTASWLTLYLPDMRAKQSSTEWVFLIMVHS